MNYLTQALGRRNVRAITSAIISYIMLAGQAAPLALAASSPPRTTRAAATVPASPAPAGTVAPTNAAAPRPAPLVFAAGLSATKVDSWDDSATPDGKAEPGQVVTYTVTITNTGDADATNVQFSDSVDTNTTLDGTSVQTQPIAVPDSYPVLGNVRIQVTDPAQGLLANDRDPDTGNNTNLTASGPATTTNGGQITINSNGTFTYNPPPGFEGSNASGDKVTYTIRDTGPDTIAGNADDKTDTAVATFNVSGMVWFVNSAAGVNGDGRLTSPFNCLRGPGCFDSTTTGGAADDANDNIFLYNGTYTGGLTLLAGQKLIGQGASTTLAGIAGVTVPANSDALPTLNATPSNVTITTAVAATNGVNLPASPGAATLRGFTGGNTTGFDIASGANFGTLNASEVVLNGTGGTLNLNSGALNATFGGVSSTSSTTQGMSLLSVSGSLTNNGTTISGSTTQGVLVSGSTANIDFGNTLIGTASAGSGGTNGISLQNNSAGTRTFGTLTIQNNTGANSALLIGGGGNSGGSVTAGATTISGVPANGNDIDIQNLAAAATVSFGATSVTKTTAGALVNMSSDAGAITFNSLTGSNTAGNGIVGTDDTGALTVTNGTGNISTTGGGALRLNNSTGNQAINLNFTTLTTSGTNSGNALLLKNVGGTGLSLPNAVTFDTAAGAAETIKIQNSTATTIRVGTNGTTNNAVNINNRRSTGVLIDTAGGTIQFGTSTIANPNNVGGYGIRVQSSSAAVTFPSATIANANVTTAQGDAGNGTGSTDGDGDAIFLTGNTGSFTLNGGSITSPGNDGIDIRGTSGGVTISGVTISNPGQDVTGATGSGAGGHGISAVNLSGTNSVTGTTISGVNVASRDGIHYYSVAGGTGTMTVQGTTFQNIDGNSGITVSTSGAGNTTFTVGGATNNATTNCTFSNIAGSAINFATTGTATLAATIQRSTFNLAGTDDKTNFTAGHTVGSHVTYNILNNTFTGVMQTGSTGEGLISISADATAAGNTFAATIQGNTISNVGNATTNCGGGAQACLGPLNAIQVFIDDNANVPGTIVIDTNNITAAQQAGILLDLHNSGAAAGSGVAAKITNNTIGTNAAPVGTNTGATTTYGVRVERRANGGPAANVLVSGNNIVNGNANASTLNGPGIHARTKANDSMSVTVTGNSINTTGSGVAEIRMDTNANDAGDIVAPTQCSDISGNSFPAGGGVIDINEVNGTHNVEQASAAAVATANGGATVTADAGVSFGITCAAPPPGADVEEDLGGGDGSLNPGDGGTPVGPAPLGGRTSLSGATTSGGVTSAPFVSPRLSTSRLSGATAEAAQPTRSASTATTTAASSPTRTTAPVISGAGGTVNVNIGTLAAGDSVTITFKVMLDLPYTGGSNISNQGQVTSSNVATILTDDPDTAAPNDATLTPVNAAKIQANDAKQPEPPSGTSQMLFVISSSTAAGAGGITVNYATAAGGANPATPTAGATCDGSGDYVAASGTATIPSGSRVTTVPVTVCSDANNAETDETLLLNINTPSTGTVIDPQATGTITTANTPGTFIISEFRHRGPSSANDDFVELYNNTGANLTVAASDTSAGYGVYKMGATCADSPVLLGTVPNGTVIPARGHYLLVGSAYSLANYGGTGAAAGNNAPPMPDIEDDRNIAVFSTADVGNISSASRLDAVGFGTNTGGICDLMSEGTTLAPVGPLAGVEYSYFRKECDLVPGIPCASNGYPKDSNVNASDFFFADTAMTNIAGITRRLGAPGPENLASPIRRDDTILSVPLLDSSNGKTQATDPNNLRVIQDNPGSPTSAKGLMFIRRRVQNTSLSTTVTRMRFRIMESTTGPTPPIGTADLRLIDSTDVVISGITDPATCASTGTPTTTPCQVTAKGVVLETPPAQPNGGGYNSTVTITIPGGLAPGASVDVNFQLGVMQGGAYRFYLIVEALP